MSGFNIKEIVKLQLKKECRVCLKKGTIFIHGDNSKEDLAGAISTFGGIDISIFDPYPKYLCESCQILLQQALLFRKIAQSSDLSLKKSLLSNLSTDDSVFSVTDVGNDAKEASGSYQNDLCTDNLNSMESEHEIDDNDSSSVSGLSQNHLCTDNHNSMESEQQIDDNDSSSVSGSSQNDLCMDNLNSMESEQEIDDNDSSSVSGSSQNDLCTDNHNSVESEQEIDDNDSSSPLECDTTVIPSISEPEVSLEKSKDSDYLFKRPTLLMTNARSKETQEDQHAFKQFTEVLENMKQAWKKHGLEPITKKHMKRMKYKGPTLLITNATSKETQEDQHAFKQYVDALENMKLAWKQHGLEPITKKHMKGMKISNTKYFTNKIAVNPLNKPTVEIKVTFKCTLCDLTFGTKQELQVHNSTHRPKFIKCSVCDKVVSANSFRGHKRIHEGKPCVCDVCGKMFKVGKAFLDHLKIHSKDFPFKCTLCPYKTNTKENLKIHMRSHTGERPYLCEVCPKKFITKSNLIKHEYTHKKNHNFKCECGKGYCTKKDLEVHIKTHHDRVKEHVCEICGNTYGQRSVLLKHERRVHKREKLISGKQATYLKMQAEIN